MNTTSTMDGQSFAVKSQLSSHIFPSNEQPPMVIDNRSRRSYIVYAESLLFVYGLLVQVLRLKYKGKSQTCFDTHSFLIHTSIAAFLVAGLSLTLLMCDYQQSRPAAKQWSPLVYRILNFATLVSGIVAHLTIWLILIFD